MNKWLKIIILGIGIIYYGAINVLSYTVMPYQNNHPIILKIAYSLLSFLILAIVYILLIKPKMLYKKEISKDMIIALYIGILIIPLISLV
ncbi:MAG: hypothetical protein RBQ97_04335 [Acholeplasma sp.]|nr:hypothetical protein [Acholeplasma sp.]